MASPHACAALVDVFPDLLRARRSLVGTSSTPAVAALAVVRRHGPSRLTEIAEHLSLDLSTVSRQVTHLRQKGLLESHPDPEDGRSQRLSVTPAGTEVLRGFRRSVVDRLVDRLEGWGDGDVEDLTRLLGRLAQTADYPETTTTPEPTSTGSTSATSPVDLTTMQEKELQGKA